MASFQVEIVTSAPFAHDSSSCFHKDLDNLVSPTDHDRNANANNKDFTDLWVHQPQWQTTTTTTMTKKNTTTTMTTTTTTTTNKNNNHGRRTGDKHHRRSNVESSASKESKWGRAREIVFTCTSSKDSSCISGLVQVPNAGRGGVSSLVRKWRDFEAEAKCKGKNNNASSASSTTTCQDAPAATFSEDELFGDWESDMTAISGPPSSRGFESDTAESEKLRVTDIIRKLTDERRSTDVSSDSSPRGRISFDHPLEQRPLSAHTGSPRIRGRQAYHDLLVQMERDRRKELEGLIGRKAVSKFNHRGRIQAVLRIRFLHRSKSCIEATDLNSNKTPSKSHKAVPSAITQFREKVDPSVAKGPFHNGRFHKKLKDNNSSSPNQCSANGKDNLHESEDFITSEKPKIDHNSLKFPENVNQSYEASSLSTFINEATSWDNGSQSLIESGNVAQSYQEREVSNEGAEANNYEFTGDHDPSQCSINQDYVENSTYLISDASHPDVELEELHSEYEQQESNNTDWIDEVSRPRSDWEFLRQARYQEMLDPFSDNKEEIRMLLGRRSVSTFLSSGLREKIDQVMMLRVQGKVALQRNQMPEENRRKLCPGNEQTVVTEEGEGSARGIRQEQEEEYVGYFDESEEAESSIGNQYNESDHDYMYYIESAPPASWGQNQGRESIDCSYHASSPSQQSSSNFGANNNGPNAYRTIDMELINDLRKHMEQMHQEMSELRRSIKFCMDMQIKLQRSVKKEVAQALNHSEANNGQHNPVKKRRGEGRCCVCCKMQVDSLLYRCGHMCTCYECAQELQLSNKNCPICAAPIVDVIRARSYHS